MQITEKRDHIIIDQKQYAKYVTSRLKKTLRSIIKIQENPLPTNFIPTKKDCPENEAQTIEVKKRFQNLHYRSAMGSLLYICHVAQDLTSIMLITN